MEKYRGASVKKLNPYQSNYSTNIIFSIVQAKMAELLSWMQEYDFIPLDDEAMNTMRLVKLIWQFEWINSLTDGTLAKVFQSALISWDWFMYEGTRRIVRKIKMPYETSEGLVEFKEEEVVEYEGIYSEYIPWEFFYHDWETINEANEAIWIKHWDRKTFINTFKDNPNYKNVNEDLPIGRYYYIAQDKAIVLDWNINDSNVVTELRYYNKSKDQFISMVNGVTVCDMPIPYKHKELPFCQYIDYFLPWRAYNMWEYELLSKDEEYKDAIRGLSIDVVKAQMWFTVISPDADFDEWTIEWGPNNYSRIAPEDIRHFSPSISNNSLYQAEQKADEDIIIKSWIDFRSQILWPWETATKVQAKTQSARKRINLNLKMNAYNFFERLARLRMSNIQLLYSSWRKKIPTKGKSVASDGSVTKLNGWYGLYTVDPKHVAWKFNVVPITDSILWTSSERTKARMLEYAQIASAFTREDGKPVINQEKLAEKLSKMFDIDYEELSSSSVVNKTWEELIWEIDMLNKGMEPWGFTDPNYIPPEQRSWAQNSKIGGLTNTLPLE